jgi:hypothetical protein
MKYYITEKDWQVIYTYLKTVSRIHIKDEYKTRIFIEAMDLLSAKADSSKYRLQSRLKE